MMRRRDFLLSAAAAGRAMAASTQLPEASRALAVTVDDLPAARRSFPAPLLGDFCAFRARNHEFLARAAKRSAVLSGFVNEGWTPRSWPKGALEELLGDWLDAGAELGNHTYSHLDLYGTTVQRYLAEIVLGEAKLGSVLATRNRRIRYFRHPYLHMRKNGQDSAQIDDYLERSGYRTAPVTIDTQDWIFAEIYAWALARGDEPRRAATAKAYLEYFAALLDHAGRTSQETLGREPAQVLLIHLNALNFDLIRDLLDCIRERAYRFVSLEEALEDSVYLEAIPPRGSWIHGWRQARGLEKAEDPLPARFLGPLLVDYKAVKSTMSWQAAPQTKRIGDI